LDRRPAFRSTIALTAALAVFALVVATGLAAAGGGTARDRPHRGASHCPKRHRRHHGHVRHGFGQSPRNCPANPTPSQVTAHTGHPVDGHVTQGPYPAAPPPPGGETGDTEAETQVKIPAGRFVHEKAGAVQAPPAAVTGVEARPSGRRAPNDTQVIRDVSLKDPAMPVASSLGDDDGGEQSVATTGSIVLYTSNNRDAISTDGGASFSPLDPATLFPTAAGGFCCDQVVTYLPRRKRFVWVLQYWGGDGGVFSDRRSNVIRVATATAKEALNSQWTYYDFVPSDFGFRKPHFSTSFPQLDRAHLTFTRGSIYLTADGWGSKGKSFLGTALWRIPQGQLGKGTIGYQWLQLPKTASKVRPAQEASDKSPVQFLAGAATTSRLDVFRWTDADNFVSMQEVDVGTIATEDTTSRDPARVNWMDRYGKQAGAVVTGAHAGNSLLFGWMYGRRAKVINDDGSESSVKLHDQPGLGFAVINTDTNPLKRVAGAHIEFADFAAALPLLRMNTDGATALSFMYGGPGGYPSHAVGFLIGYSAAQTVAGQSPLLEPSVGGDYVGLTNIRGTQCFAAAGSATKRRQSLFFRNYIDPHYIVFGRESAHCAVPPPPPPPAPPDLVVDRVYSNYPDVPDDFCDILADVHNVGGGAAPATMTRFLDNAASPTFDQLVPTPALGPGETTTVRLDREYGQNNSATVTADAQNVAAESNEANNTASGSGNPSTNGNCHFP
jgi:CARDB